MESIKGGAHSGEEKIVKGIEGVGATELFKLVLSAEPEVMNWRQRKYQGVRALSRRPRQAAALVGASKLCN